MNRYQATRAQNVMHAEVKALGGITGVVLAGGRGSRMGGRDKGLVALAGRPMICHVLDALAAQVDALLINANRNVVAYRKLGYDVISDVGADADATMVACARASDGYASDGDKKYRGDKNNSNKNEVAYYGPLAGMLSGLRVARTPYVVFAPCDAPLMPPDLVARLAAALRRENAELAVAEDGERLQPVFCLLATTLANSMAAFLASGERKIDKYFALCHMARAYFPQGDEVFANINTSHELAWAAQRLDDNRNCD